MSRRYLLLGVFAIVAIGGWYAFRPERLFISKTVDEALPGAVGMSSAEAMTNPVALLTGRFHTNAHETSGTATIYRLADGSRLLRLTDFETSNGPDVRVYLVAASDVNDNETVTRAGFVELGSMKGNIGDQNYEVPDGVDLEKYRSVTIWCRRFSVNFGTAPLMSAGPGAAMALPTTFTVRIENVSTPSTLKLSNGTSAPAPTAPVLWLVHSGTDPIFSDGQTDRGLGLESLAEDGDPSALARALKAADAAAVGTVSVPVGDSEPGPILPAKAYELSFEATPGQRLTLAFMFGQSNDLFYAPSGAGIPLFDAQNNPLSGDITSRLTLWDAGTEVNQEPGLGPDQAPRQKASNTGAAENGKVRRVADDFNYPAVGQVIRVSVTPESLRTSSL